MPLQRKTRHKKRYKSILRKGKRSRKRTRRVRFLGGKVGTRWYNTQQGQMTEEEFGDHQTQLSPDSY